MHNFKISKVINGIQDIKFSQQCYKDSGLSGCFYVFLATNSQHSTGTTILHSIKNNYSSNITASHPRRMVKPFNIMVKSGCKQSIAYYKYHTSVPNSSGTYLHLYFPPNHNLLTIALS